MPDLHHPLLSINSQKWISRIHQFPHTHFQGYHNFIDEMLPHESPVHYGLHPNAEIEFLTVTSDSLFHTLLELQSPDAVMGEGTSQTLEEKVGLDLFFRFDCNYVLSYDSASYYICLLLDLKQIKQLHPPSGENYFRRGSGKVARRVQHVRRHL